MDDSIGPSIFSYSLPIDQEQTKFLYLTIIEYSNAIQASIYDDKPSLGSMTLSYPLVDQVERQTIFAGKHSQFSDALAMLVGRHSNKIVYASVNLEKDTVVNLDLLRQLVAQYTNADTTTQV
jgi:hypothetical protein